MPSVRNIRMTMARRLLPDLTDAKISISVKAKKKKPKFFFREIFYKKAGKKFSEIQVKTYIQKEQKTGVRAPFHAHAAH